MARFFCMQQDAFHETAVTITLRLPHDNWARGTAAAALASQRQLEGKLLKSQKHAHRTDSKVKGNTIHVVRQLQSAVTEAIRSSIIYGENHNLEEVALTQNADGVTRPDFEAIYLTNKETLSTKFNHIRTDELNGIKEALIAKIFDFDRNVLNQATHPFYKELVTQGKLSVCKEVIAQSMKLIAAAKTLSAVIASVAIEADVFAQMGVAADLTTKDTVINLITNPLNAITNRTTVNSLADLFAESLPEVMNKELARASLGTQLNAVGSAFQLEQIRESLITRLETYLANRARLDRGQEINNTVTVSYLPKDRGIFYNKPLQEARIEVAAKLLLQLQYMQLSGEDEEKRTDAITNPQLLAVALGDAIQKNNSNYEKLARTLPGGIPIDSEGEFAQLLEDVRQDIGKIYTQNVRIGSDANLREQLGLEGTPTTALVV